jgi:myo-inositol 2-dehydrogenase/D-chiro-inositol 1-dehydrogenase
MTTSRRRFLQQASVGAAGLAAPFVWTNRPARGQAAKSGLRLASIGVGGSRGRYNQGGHVARAAAQHAQMVAVCDVDDLHTAEFNRSFEGKLTTYRDYRELLEKEKPDVVTIGTPDHWHVPIAIAALRAGCDVYCEKPLTLTIDEGKIIRDVVHETGKVFQVGTQQRSDHDQLFLKAIAIVQSGRLGKKVNAHIAIGGGEIGGPFNAEPAPADLDWNMWVGGAPKSDYSERRRKEFRWYYDYSGGKMTDWGAHHIDIAQWALGHDTTGPVKITGKGKFTDVVPAKFDWHAYLDGELALPNAFHTAAKFDIDLEFADGAIMNVNDHYKSDDGTDFGNGILFVGEEGRIFVNRERLSGKPVQNLTEADNRDIEDRMVVLGKGKPASRRSGHMDNFFACIADRSTPRSDVDTHHRTMTSCHLCNIVLMLGRDLKWDPAAEKFVDDAEADTFMSRKRRAEFPLG